MGNSKRKRGVKGKGEGLRREEEKMEDFSNDSKRRKEGRGWKRGRREERENEREGKMTMRRKHRFREERGLIKG